MDAGGKQEKLTGEIADSSRRYDFDATATLAMFDPARAKDDEGLPRLPADDSPAPIRPRSSGGMKMRIDGHDGGRDRHHAFEAAVSATDGDRRGRRRRPAPRRPPRRCATCWRRSRSSTRACPSAAPRCAACRWTCPRGRSGSRAIRLASLENGKLAEFALEGLEARAPEGPVKVGRFALKSLDIANLRAHVGAIRRDAA